MTESGTGAAPQGAASLLSAEQRARLQATGLPLVVPDHLPEGFALERIEAEVDEVFGGWYRIRYAGPGPGSFEVDAMFGGVGDVFRGEERHEFRCPAFGEGVLEWYAPETEPVDFRSHWMHGAAEYPVCGVAGQGVPLDVALRVAASLAFLT